MIRKHNAGVEWLEFELFQHFPNLKAVIFLRHGGHSDGPYSSLNLSYTMNDDALKVDQNVAKAMKAIGISRLATVNQVHGSYATDIDNTNWNAQTSADAMVTNLLNLPLKITHADCQSAIIYDPIKHIIANIHCGWRGQTENIYAKTIKTLKSKFQCNPADLHVAIGPSLGPLAAEFQNYRTELPAPFWEFQTSLFHFDLWSIAEMQLREAGISPAHMQIARLCTSSNEHDFFSYRGQKRVTGAHATIATLM